MNSNRFNGSNFSPLMAGYNMSNYRVIDRKRWWNSLAVSHCGPKSNIFKCGGAFDCVLITLTQFSAVIKLFGELARGKLLKI